MSELAMENEDMLLRRLSDLLSGGNAGTWDQIEHAIATLTAENARLRAEGEKFKRHLGECHTRASAAEARTRALEAALEDLLRHTVTFEMPSTIIAKARAALTEPKDGEQ